ncbi:GMC family oxidoreductase [Halobacteriovorax marinus]|uniref:GMC family oxidoreductase n=1 Tax=Halobacteriovorax marinus TaxID=97084 RepID=UPI003A9497BE
MIYSESLPKMVDVCIVGSGIGGGSLALKLAEREISFVIVEAGAQDSSSEKVRFENVGREFGLRSTTAIQLGGTSTLWHGVLAPLDEVDFEEREWIPNSGWPISLSDLEPYYEEASELLGVRDYSYFDSRLLSTELANKLLEMNFNRRVFENKMFQQPLPEKNFSHDLLELVKDSEKYNLLINTVGLELLKGRDGLIRALKVGGGDGNTFEVKARCFVSAAGALETPRLLMNSNIENGNIGKYLMDHPMANLCQVRSNKKQRAHLYSAIKYKDNIAIKTGIELKKAEQKKHRLPNHNFYMRPTFTRGIDNETEKIKLSLLAFKDGGVTLRDLWKVVSNLNVVFQVLLYKFSLNPWYKYSDLFFVTEQTPFKDSCVELSEKVDAWGYRMSRVNWQVSEWDLSAMIRWYELVESECYDKMQYEYTYEFDSEDWERNFTSAAHHVGTARMSNSKENGVVDKNLNVFDVRNLFLCDGSVFTTSGNVNSGFTISALACRLAKHLDSKISENYL